MRFPNFSIRSKSSGEARTAAKALSRLEKGFGAVFGAAVFAGLGSRRAVVFGVGAGAGAGVGVIAGVGSGALVFFSWSGLFTAVSARLVETGAGVTARGTALLGGGRESK